MSNFADEIYYLPNEILLIKLYFGAIILITIKNDMINFLYGNSLQK
tara:strand:- start:3637 stop:3774 length:138 start_codon:yes stop_codon:yes gene_type:complete